MVNSYENKPQCSGHLSKEDTISENQWCPLRSSTVYPHTRDGNGKYGLGGPRNYDFRYMLKCI